MTSTSSVVDGQQRLTTILQFVDNELAVQGRHFRDLSASEKEAFLKYEIAIVDLDLSHDDTTIIEIFKRLNRTFYALSNIEKQATEFAFSEFMVTAKYLAGEVGRYSDEDEFEFDSTRIDNDPNITSEFLEWARSTDVKPYQKWLLQSGIFSAYEISRQVHLSYTLLLMTTFVRGIFQRNQQVQSMLEEFKDEFQNRDQVVERLVSAATTIDRARVTKQFWRRKANAFSLMVAVDVARSEGVVVRDMREKLNQFELEVTPEYMLAAKEGVNNRKERMLRHVSLCQKIFGIEIAAE